MTAEQVHAQYGPPGAAPPPPGMPGYGAPMGGGMGGGPPGAGADIKKQSQTWLIIALVTWFACGNGCFGIIGALLAYFAGQAVDQGDIAGAESKLKWSKILTIGGVVVMALLFVAYIVLVVGLGVLGSL